MKCKPLAEKTHDKIVPPSRGLRGVVPHTLNAARDDIGGTFAMMELWLPSSGGPPLHRIGQPLKAGATDDGRNVLIWGG